MHAQPSQLLSVEVTHRLQEGLIAFLMYTRWRPVSLSGDFGFERSDSTERRFAPGAFDSGQRLSSGENGDVRAERRGETRYRIIKRPGGHRIADCLHAGDLHVSLARVDDGDSKPDRKKDCSRQADVG